MDHLIPRTNTLIVISVPYLRVGHSAVMGLGSAPYLHVA